MYLLTYILYNIKLMLVKNNKILNIVHTDGYELIKVKFEDISPEDNLKFKIERPLLKLKRLLPDIDFTESISDEVYFIRPTNIHKLDLMEFNIEDIYLDIKDFIDENIYMFDSIEKIIEYSFNGFEPCRESFMKLINKYGWCNWANEQISGKTYNGLKSFNKNYGLNFNQVFFDKNSHVQDYSSIYTEIQKLAVSQEVIFLWAELIINSDLNIADRDDRFIKNINFRIKENGKYEIQPLSIGSKLIYFEKLQMINYTLDNCKFCSKRYINKKGRLFCSNSCRVKNHNIKNSA